MINLRTGKHFNGSDNGSFNGPRMTRGGFLKGILASGIAPSITLATIANAGSAAANASVGGMMRNVGARNAAMFGGGLSAKSYVQDGLVAMWDGIENAGWGTHNPTAQTWKELISGECATATGTLAWTDNGLRCSGSSYATFQSDLLNTLFASPENEFTIEVFAVADFVAKQTGLCGPLFVGDPYIRIWMLNINYNSEIKLPLVYNFREPQSSWSSAYVFGVKTATATYNPRDSSYKFYKNGSFAKNIINEGATSKQTFVKLGISAHGIFVGELCFVRIYDNALAEEEIAYNYTVDKARYNLT